MQFLIGFLAVTVATAAWTDSPRYGADYVGGSRMSDSGQLSSNCIPCEERRFDGSSSNSIDYRGNGADNLGYDWSPTAWGGPAFPKSAEGTRPNSDWGGRDGRRMPGTWNDKCRDCQSAWPGAATRWDRFTERPDIRGNRPEWSSSTEQPADVSTVTSSVLGIRLRDDKRLPVEWGGRSMRWDGFRNGMPWDRPDPADRMDRRDGSDFRSWDSSNKGSPGWDRDGQRHYASDWSYGSRDPAGSGTRWNGQRPWTQSWDQRKPNDYDQGGSSPPFGSSYPSDHRFPSNPNPSSTWKPATSAKPYYNYPTSGRPGASPEIVIRPGIGDRPDRPPQDSGAPWNYSPDNLNKRPSQWPSKPNENYLPQNHRPTSSVPGDYGRPTRPNDGVPGTAIWNGRPGSDEYRPGHGSKPPNGFYQGFITEIHDPNYSQGIKFPSNRPGYNENRYPSDRPSHPQDGYNRDRYPSSRPSDGYSPGNQYPSNSRLPDRYDKPGQGNNFYPHSRPDTWNGNPGYDSNRDRYPDRGYENSRPGYDTDRDRYPDRNQYESERDRDRYGPNYSSRPQYGGNRDSDRWYPDYDRDRDRYPSDSNRRPGYGHQSEQYPSSRPSSSDHDRGPNPDSDQGSWNYGEDGHKDGTYRRSGGSYPPYKGGKYFTSGYLASASTPAASSQEVNKKNDETTVATSQEK